MKRPANHVFSRFNPRPAGHVITNQKPAVGVFAWFPQRNPTFRIQPHERGTFFVALGRSGLGSVGLPGEFSDSGHAGDVTGVTAIGTATGGPMGGIPVAHPRVHKPGNRGGSGYR